MIRLTTEAWSLIDKRKELTTLLIYAKIGESCAMESMLL